MERKGSSDTVCHHSLFRLCTILLDYWEYLLYECVQLLTLLLVDYEVKRLLRTSYTGCKRLLSR